MPELPEGARLVGAAVAAFGERLLRVRDADWGRATPCAGWAVRDLVGHVIDGNRLAVALLGGRELGEPARLPVAGLAAAFRDSATAQDAAFEAAAPDTMVRHPAETLTAQRFAVYRAADIAVHAWDLARAVGGDEVLGDELLRGAVQPYVAWVDTLDAPGEFAPAGRARAATTQRMTAQERLLGRLGRHA